MNRKSKTFMIRQHTHGLSNHLSLIILCIFLVIVMMTGGASRPDAQSQIIVRLAAIGFITIALFRLKVGDLVPYRTLLIMLGALAALMTLQLVPLPPAIWTNLPGRKLFAEAAALGGFAQPWRPISLTPDLTINSLLSLSVPLATVLLFASLPREHWFAFIALFLILVGLSAVVGVLQITGRMDGLYLYRITNPSSAVGLFANRNHQAVFLATALPFLAAFLIFPRQGKGTAKQRKGIVAVVAMLVLPLILITGSRAGLVLMIMAGIAAWLLYARSKQDDPVQPAHSSSRRGKSHGHRRHLPLQAIALAGGAAAIIAVTVLLARAEAVQRLFSQDLAQDRRFELFGPMLKLAWKYFPVGSGFGSFADVFRIDEPLSNLRFRYMNHAHNDLIEVVIEGGLISIILLAAFGAWWMYRTAELWKRSFATRRFQLLGRLGTIIVVILLLASLADYPLRTPIMACVFTLSCCLMCQHARLENTTART